MSTTRDHVVTAYRDEHGTWKARCRCGIRWEGERTRTLTVAACRQSCHVGQVEALERAIPLQVAEYARGADPWGLTYARVNLR
uniref:hypothetical protein n=1 Tax=Microbacterium sp. TaxID=51671 RepID=UPI002609BE95